MAINYQGKKVAVLGYGQEGPAAYKYWSNLGAQVTIHDQNEQLKIPDGASAVLGDEYLKNLDKYDLVVRSPGVFPYKFKTSTPITSVINEFMHQCRGTIIGITGTKGKGTTASLIYHILKTAGEGVYLAGNIGVPPLKYLPQITEQDYVVLELSNVQLWDVDISPRIAVLLMVVPEHLDWHRGNVTEYISTKTNITRFQSSSDSLIYDGDDPTATDIASTSKAIKQPFTSGQATKNETVWIDNEDNIKYKDTVVCNVADVPLIGRHNLPNVCAAIAVTYELIKEPGTIKEAIKSYQPLPHRLEPVGTVDGVAYYDDSIATHPVATIGAIEAFDQPKVLILGGASKGEVDYKELAKVVKGASIRGVILSGETSSVITEVLGNTGYDGPIRLGLESMEEIIKEARALSRPGDVVLLSPACASFGLFKNYADRGSQFKTAVKELKHKRVDK